MASQNTKPSSKKPKLVRDSFTIPKAEFAAIDLLKTRAIGLGTSVKKSELLRAGLMLLTGLNDGALKAALAAVPTLKTGRPAAHVQATPATKSAVARKPVAKAAKTANKPAAKPAQKTAVKAAAKPAAKPAVKAATKPAAKARPAVKVAAAKPAVTQA